MDTNGPAAALRRALATLGPALATLWRALPGDLLGRLIVGLVGARTVRRVPVPDGRSTTIVALVVEDPRLARLLDAVPLRPTAMTFGRYVFARGALPDATVRHELEHVRQWAHLGPLFLPAYVADSIRLQLAGRDRYRDNRFEVAARERETAPESSTGSSSAAGDAGRG